MRRFESDYTAMKGSALAKSLAESPGQASSMGDSALSLLLTAPALSIHPALAISRILFSALARPCAKYLTQSDFEEDAGKVQGLNELERGAERVRSKLEKLQAQLESNAHEIRGGASAVRRTNMKLHAFEDFYETKQMFEQYSNDLADLIGAAHAIVRNLQALDDVFDRLERERRAQSEEFERVLRDLRGR